ncbi:MAG TPA: T9SS type A sorting domain-containing protein [Cyclobacteriaceae bacterium]
MKSRLFFNLYFWFIAFLLVCFNTQGQSVITSPSKAVPGQTLTVSFTGLNGVKFSQYSPSCGTQKYNVNNANIYFQRVGSSERIYPTGINPVNEGASEFRAVFKIPRSSVIGQYDFIIDNYLCSLNSASAFNIEQSSTVVASPSETVQGATLTVSFTAMGGTTFSQFTESCNTEQYKIDLDKVYFQQFTSSTKIFSNSISFAEGASSFVASFTIPEWLYPTSYDFVVEGAECAIVSKSAFNVKPQPGVSLSPYYSAQGKTVKINFTGTNGALFSKSTANCSSTIFHVATNTIYLKSDYGNQFGPIYPISVKLQDEVTSYFEATFSIPETAAPNQYYRLVINSGQCLLNAPDAFFVAVKPSVSIQPNSGLQGQKLKVSFTGTNGARFSQFTESCDNNLFRVNNNNVYFKQFSSTARIYPESIDVNGYAANNFDATFSIPAGANVSGYSAVIENTGCRINEENVFNVKAEPSVMVSPSSASQGQTLKVTFTGINGATFSQFTETCSANIYRVTPGNVYMQQLSSTTRIFANSINSPDYFTTSFDANFSIPSGAVTGDYDVYVNNWGDCQLKATTSFKIFSSNIIEDNCIIPLTPTISLKELTLTSSSDLGNQWYLNGIAIPGATGVTCKVKEAGAYTVTTQTGVDCISDPSEPIVVTALPEGAMISIYPNPVGDELTITLESAALSEVIIYDIVGRVKDKISTSDIRFKINTSGYGEGSYIIQVRQDNAIFRKQFLKE